MKILHTSDWHLGRNLYGRKRYEEFEAFLSWLYDAILQENIDTLLICGDIFDTNTPSNKAQELYYQFLCKVSLSSCQNIIIIAGNHDSPSFLEAPKNILSALNIHVIGTADVASVLREEEYTQQNWQEKIPKEMIVLKNKSTNKSHTKIQDKKNIEYQAIICAVPYLRDKDMRQSELGESFEEKNTKLLQGIQKYYLSIAQKAHKIQEIIYKEQGNKIPIIALGHLFVAGGLTRKGDGVRDLYVGSLNAVGADCFSPLFDYVALGHLHIEQIVNKNKYIQYSGSPIPMSFGEANQTKKVYLLDINPEKESSSITKKITAIEVPSFQALQQISGDLEHIQKSIQNLCSAQTKKEKEVESIPIENNKSIWLEIEYTGKEIISNLREKIEECIFDTDIEILRIRNSANYEKTLRATENLEEQKTLHDLSVHDVFEACLLAHEVPSEEQEELRKTYQEILQDLADADIKAQ